ncbi:hypothetical protein CK203_106148 [Vitis vinifera]|uniref:Retrovirus-related Pol polyprotein from transposon opus n=1 Tax=Vitis vinifera TaxID=29760 RepID=A0A438C4M5_VITVI|nr:hypothetical protein CK203_106148 [Vitis vinifera]
MREEIFPLFNEEETQEAVKEEPPKLILKPLPTELKRIVYLKSSGDPKKAIGWKISDLKGINPLACTHHIYMEEEAKPVHQPQRRLNPHMKRWCELKCLSYFRKPNVVIRKDHFPLPFIDQVLESVLGNPFYCFLGWLLREKCHFMVPQGIVLGHIISSQGIEVDKAKVELIVKLPSANNYQRKMIDVNGVLEELKLLLTTTPIVELPTGNCPLK